MNAKIALLFLPLYAALLFAISCKERCIDEGPVLETKVLSAGPEVVGGIFPLLISVTDVGQRCPDAEAVPASKVLLIVEYSDDNGLNWEVVLETEVPIASFSAAGSVTETFDFWPTVPGSYRFQAHLF